MTLTAVGVGRVGRGRVEGGRGGRGVADMNGLGEMWWRVGGKGGRDLH